MLVEDDERVHNSGSCTPTPSRYSYTASFDSSFFIFLGLITIFILKIINFLIWSFIYWNYFPQYILLNRFIPFVKIKDLIFQFTPLKIKIIEKKII